MARQQHLFAAEKIAWLLGGGLEAMSPGERQVLLVMAETTMQEGYKPTSEERQVVQRLRELGGEDYDARDIRRKVRAMVKSRSRPDAAPLKLPAMFDRLIARFRDTEGDEEVSPEP
jgi:hypothetical protein